MQQAPRGDEGPVAKSGGGESPGVCCRLIQTLPRGLVGTHTGDIPHIQRCPSALDCGWNQRGGGLPLSSAKTASGVGACETRCEDMVLLGHGRRHPALTSHGWLPRHQGGQAETAGHQGGNGTVGPTGPASSVFGPMQVARNGRGCSTTTASTDSSVTGAVVSTPPPLATGTARHCRCGQPLSVPPPLCRRSLDPAPRSRSSGSRSERTAYFPCRG